MNDRDRQIARYEDDGGPPLEFDRERYEAEDIVSRLETRARIRRELKRGNAKGVDRIADLLESAAQEIKSLRQLAFNLGGSRLTVQQPEFKV